MPLSTPAKTGERQELDISLALVFTLALIITVGIYLLVLPVRESFLGILLYDRGFTQHLTVYLASAVLVLTLLKYFKLFQETQALRQAPIPEQVSLADRNSRQVINLHKNLTLDRSLIASRCARVLAAYRDSGSRKAATELALDDSSFYLSASESTYALPRILVWAIPLMGFIGTVVGISQAVTGFSGFLEEAGAIEQIRDGIGTVTSGLATAFDTTLLALLLSVAVMIPLVMVERFESRFLLAVDIYINDKLLPKFRDKTDLDEVAINHAVEKAIQEHFPKPETLVEPAHQYAQQAATLLAEGFVAEVGKIQTTSAKLVEQMSQLNQIAWQDRQAFMSVWEEQQQVHRTLTVDIQTLVNEIKTGYTGISTDLATQAQQISHQLQQAAHALEARIEALEKSTDKVGEFARLQHNLEQSLRSLEQAAHLEKVLLEVRNSLAQLQPALERLNKPRRITLFEQD